MDRVSAEALDDFVTNAIEPGDYPGDDESPEVEAERERWSITDEGAAAYAVRRHAHALSEISKAERLAAEQKRQIDRYVESVRSEHERTISFFEMKLREFYETVFVPNRGKSWTMKLPGGRLRSNSGGLSAVVKDPEALLSWLKKHGQGACIRQADPAPALDAIKALFGPSDTEEPGEYPALDPKTKKPIPGIVYERKPRTFTVEPEGEGL